MNVITVFSAILPSLCVSLIMLFFTRMQNKRDKKKIDSEEAAKTSERLQVVLLLSTAKLSYAVAIALKNGGMNGEVDDAINQYKEAMKEFKKFERKLVADKSYDR